MSKAILTLHGTQCNFYEYGPEFALMKTKILACLLPFLLLLSPLFMTLVLAKSSHALLFTRLLIFRHGQTKTSASSRVRVVMGLDLVVLQACMPQEDAKLSNLNPNTSWVNCARVDGVWWWARTDGWHRTSKEHSRTEGFTRECNRFLDVCNKLLKVWPQTQ